MPNQTAEFKDWFATATANARSDSQKGAKSIVILTMWNLWRTRNDAIFNNVSPNRQHVVQTILEEAKSWSLAGASALRRLPLHARPPDLLSDDPSV
jgi:5-methylthioribose kinase